jgi:hypothetical protein
MTTQDPLTRDVLNAIGMTDTEADQHPRRAATRAASVLVANGFRRGYCHEAWNRGRRWYAPNSHGVPCRDLCATTTLGVALVSGDIVTRWSDLQRINEARKAQHEVAKST